MVQHTERLGQRLGVEHDPIGVFDDDEPARLRGRDHRRDRTLSLADVLEDTTRVREVELARGQRIVRDVVHAELEVRVVTFEEALVHIGREHVTVGSDEGGQRTRHRSAPGTDLEAAPTWSGAEPAQTADRRLVEQRSELVESLPFDRGRVVRRAIRRRHRWITDLDGHGGAR